MPSAKTCKKYNIPRPSPGYWAKIQHGHAVTKPKLPKLDDPQLQTIRITPIPEHVREPPLSDETNEKVRAEKSDEKKIVVPDTLDSPHSLVVKTQRSLNAAKADWDGSIRPLAKYCLSVIVGNKDSIDRAMRIMDTILKACEQRGMKVSIVEEDRCHKTVIEVDGEKLDVRLHEMISEQEREFTAQELREQKTWGYKSEKPKEKVGRGLFVLSLGGEKRWGDRRRWSDKDARIEDRLNNFVSWLYKAAAKVKHDRERWERVRIEREEEARREAIRQQKRWRRERRIKQLETEVAAWERANRIRAYVDAVERTVTERNGEIAPDSKIGKWIKWARRFARSIDPLR